MECNQRGNLLLTSTAWRSPMSALWDIGAFFEMKLPLENEDYVEFGKLQDRIIGTQGESATVNIINVLICVYIQGVQKRLHLHWILYRIL